MAARPAQTRRTAKMDLLTGFTGKKPPDLDLGLNGSGYFERWTTVSLPDTGKNSAVDDEQQPQGSGAPETSVAGAPLKTPMEAEDVERPRIREGREASRQRANVLRRVAMDIRRLDPRMARRLMAAADELSYDALSTASLPEAGDESNEVDDYQDNLGHGTLSFFGTDPARSTSLSRESSRRRAGEGKYSPCEVSSKLPGKNWETETCDSKSKYDKLMKDLKKKGAETRVKYLDRDVDSNLQYASRGAARRRSAAGPNAKDVKWSSLDLVGRALDGEYDRAAVANLLKADFDRTMSLLKTPGQQQEQGTSQAAQSAPAATSATSGWAPSPSASRRARTQGDKPLKPQPTVGDQDGPGADGAGGFANRSKAPLQKTMAADDVERPNIRENPEASRSLWNSFKTELLRRASVDGTHNSGQYTLEARDYGDSVEVQASVIDRERMHLPVGSVLFSVLHDSPQGRYATVEINDGILENRTTEFTIRKPRHASKIVARLVGGITRTAKDILNEVTV